MTSTAWRQLYGALVCVDEDIAAPRWLDAHGTDVFKTLIDFTESPGQLGPWVSTLTQGGTSGTTFAHVAGQGGIARVTTDNADGDGINAQLGTAGIYVPGNACYTYFGVRFKVSEATQSKWYFGLSDVDTDVIGGPSSDGIAMRKPDGSTSAVALAASSSSETTTTLFTQDADQYHILEFLWKGPSNRVDFYVDDVIITTALSTFGTVPRTMNLLPTFAYKTGEAVSHTLDMDWMRIIQIGRAS